MVKQHLSPFRWARPKAQSTELYNSSTACRHAGHATICKTYCALKHIAATSKLLQQANCCNKQIACNKQTRLATSKQGCLQQAKKACHSGIPAQCRSYSAPPRDQPAASRAERGHRCCTAATTARMSPVYDAE